MRDLSRILPKKIVHKNASLACFSTLKVGGQADYVLLPRNKKELLACIKVCKNYKLNFKIIGNASNILFLSCQSTKVFISTRNMQDRIVLHQTRVKVSAGTNLNSLILWCAERGLSGLENLFGIPATIGGAVANNAGAFSTEIFDCLESVEVLKEGKIQMLEKSQIPFGHHFANLQGAIVLSAEFELKRLAPSVIFSLIRQVSILRAEKQPTLPNAGSVFKATSDGIPAGKLIDLASLKGTSIGQAMISDKHANFIVNLGGAEPGDIVMLINLAKSEVENKFGKKLELEIEIVGEEDE